MSGLSLTKVTILTFLKFNLPEMELAWAKSPNHQKIKSSQRFHMIKEKS